MKRTFLLTYALASVAVPRPCTPQEDQAAPDETWDSVVVMLQVPNSTTHDITFLDKHSRLLFEIEPILHEARIAAIGVFRVYSNSPAWAPVTRSEVLAKARMAAHRPVNVLWISYNGRNGGFYHHFNPERPGFASASLIFMDSNEPLLIHRIEEGSLRALVASVVDDYMPQP